MAERRCLIVATDFSVCANWAVERAAITAAEHGLALLLTHIRPGGFSGRLKPLFGTQAGARASDHHERLQHEAEAIERRYGVEVATQLLTGSPVKVLQKLASKITPDMIVLGARGQSGLKDVVIGSIGKKLIDRTSHPMLIVKNPPQNHYRRVLVPVDFNDASLRALALAQKTAPLALIHAVHFFELFVETTLRFAGVDESTIETQRSSDRLITNQRLKDFVRSAGVPQENLSIHVLLGNPIFKIVEFEQHMQTDLICMGGHAGGPLQRALLGSVSEQILADSKCDLMIIK